MNKKIITGIIGVVIVAGGSFYAGMAYGERSSSSARGQFANGQFTGAGVAGLRGARGGGGGFVSGEILSKDTTSITIKMQDNSTKIALTSTSTQVMKSAPGTLDDLSAGMNVVVTGSANSDGSITAQSVQIRPASSTPRDVPVKNN